MKTTTKTVDRNPVFLRGLGFAYDVFQNELEDQYGLTIYALADMVFGRRPDQIGTLFLTANDEF